MAQLPQSYTDNNENSDEKKIFPPIPGGDYKAIIEDSEYAPNNEKTGMNLKLVWQIIEGSNKGSKLFEYLCLEHPKISTEQQAIRSFNKINDICGFSAGGRAQNSTQLHNIPMMIEIECKIEKDFPNSIKKHSAITGGAPAATTTTAPTPTDAQAQPAQPWLQK